MRIGIDAGGTFTDFVVAHAGGRIESFKLRSNPRSPADVILEGLERAGAGSTEVVHGSTVATNALLERKGAKTALVTTAGFEDVIQIGRQNRERLYDLNPPPRRPLIPREAAFGVEERTFFDGTLGRTPPSRRVREVKRRLKRAGFESVAISFLHSYANPENERQVAELLGDGWYICSSHKICPEFREYERTSTTVLNAYVGPLMDRYLARLPKRVLIMQSNGGMMTTAEARSHAVRTLLSGPAGGVIGAAGVSRASGFRRILGFDMGGTSTDVSLVDGEPRLSMEAAIDRFPVRVPMLDIHTVGAGGGSIARVDEGGLLRVGPESAGADPGPACYGRGEQPTVTDAHVLLGRIAPERFLGGEMRLDAGRAEAAIGRIARALKLDIYSAAHGIVRVANANMERAIRVVSVERGHDPRDFALAAFGGCGGLHACEIARELGIRTVLVPEKAGVLSALGMLMANRVRDYAAGVLGAADHERRFRNLEREARRSVRGAEIERLADVRYRGQSYELTIPWGADFHAEHERVYGYADRGRATEVVTLRVRAIKQAPPMVFERLTRARGGPQSRRIRMGNRWVRAAAFERAQISGPVRGPALIFDYGATTYVPPQWTARLDAVGTLIIVS